MRKFNRLRALIEVMPKGDQDREELLELLSLFDRLATRNKILEGIQRNYRQAKEELRQTRGALALAKWACKEATLKLEEGRLTIGWLSRRIKQTNRLTDYEKAEIQKIDQELNHNAKK